jgi:hypothetical protein
VKDAWPEFIGHELVANALFNRAARSFPRFCVVGTAPDGTVVASGRSAPFAFGGPGRTDLLATGWDKVLVWVFTDEQRGNATNTAVALEIAVAREYTGQGLVGNPSARDRAAYSASGSRGRACFMVGRTGATSVSMPVSSTASRMAARMRWDKPRGIGTASWDGCHRATT